MMAVMVMGLQGLLMLCSLISMSSPQQQQHGRGGQEGLSPNIVTEEVRVDCSFQTSVIKFM